MNPAKIHCLDCWGIGDETRYVSTATVKLFCSQCWCIYIDALGFSEGVCVCVFCFAVCCPWKITIFSGGRCVASFFYPYHPQQIQPIPDSKTSRYLFVKLRDALQRPDSKYLGGAQAQRHGLCSGILGCCGYQRGHHVLCREDLWS